jgi:hypothetical protein
MVEIYTKIWYYISKDKAKALLGLILKAPFIFYPKG